MSILAINAGSSSLKLAVFGTGDPPRRAHSASIERLGRADHPRALDDWLDALAPADLAAIVAVGHRFVHGGADFVRPTRIDGAVRAALGTLAAIDPTHLPAELALVDAIGRRWPALPQVACFDTAFFAGLPSVARLLPIPRRYQAAGVRRYGFHGLSYAFLMAELTRLGAAGGRVLLAHLGSGASLAAVRDGNALDTTMSFTPASGVVMGTRPGDLDPGVLLYLMRTGLSVDALDEMLHQHSGLAGVSEQGGDLRDLMAHEASDSRAADAVALFSYSISKAAGALVAVLGGIDTLVFAGGIGEHAAPVRERICASLGHLGVTADEAANRDGRPVISSGRCTVRILHTDEESMIARQTAAVVEEPVR